MIPKNLIVSEHSKYRWLLIQMASNNDELSNINELPREDSSSKSHKTSRDQVVSSKQLIDN